MELWGRKEEGKIERMHERYSSWKKLLGVNVEGKNDGDTEKGVRRRKKYIQGGGSKLEQFCWHLNKKRDYRRIGEMGIEKEGSKWEKGNNERMKEIE